MLFIIPTSLFQVNYNDGGVVDARENMDSTWQENLSDYNSDVYKRQEVNRPSAWENKQNPVNSIVVERQVKVKPDEKPSTSRQ